MKRLLILALLSGLFVACSTSDYDEPTPAPRSRPPMGDDGFSRARTMMGVGLEMLPPDDWWHDDRIAGPVKLTTEQMQGLDKIGHDLGNEIAHLERDTMVAVRELRGVLGAEKPSSDEIIASAQRLRALRDNVFDRQAQMLAAERALLSQKQWDTLQEQLQFMRSFRNDRRGIYPGGGRGGFGPRRPGWPG